MKSFFLAALIVLTLSCTKENTVNFIINKNTANTKIFVDPNADELIKWAAKDLATDLSEISGREITVKLTSEFSEQENGIFIGKIDDQLIKALPAKHQGELSKEWEKFIIEKNTENLFIVGSDIRGTVFGIFDVAERLGISPWKWWADVHLEKKEELILNLPKQGIIDSPSVKFRGIFLNDEDWGLQPWAAKTFEPETGDIGPKTYEKIFQLLLRLKANTIWPAMHPSTQAFFTIPGNRAMAEKYHISIGTSHAEPMLRNNVDEWDHEKYGDFNYFTNSERVKQYWQERISEAKNGNNIISLGMRGIHDSGMEGNATEEEKVKLLETIIADQREMLSKTINKPIEEIPQVFTIYKEVLELYNNGLQVPEDITLIWTDDNYGYIRRLSNEDERKRKGGSGVYYHLSYWGRPHDYLWLSSTQPGLIWYEMSRAYQNGAQDIWIANVGDIKPGEYAMEFFLDLAWDVNSIDENNIRKHLETWAAREFGDDNSTEIAAIMDEYYRLAMLRKPEYMGWSQTEPITPTRLTEFTPEEAENRLKAYTSLIEKTEAIKRHIPDERADAFFQLVEYPVKGAAFMNQKFLFAQQAQLSTEPKEKEQLSLEAYKNIEDYTKEYNERNNGKWKAMMSMNPRNLPVYNLPDYSTSDSIISRINSLPKKNLVAIQANEFSSSKGIENYEWRSINGLGYSNASVTLFPFENHSFVNQKPTVTYTFEVEKAGKYQVEVRFLPTHSNDFNHKTWLQVNDEEAKEYVLNTRGRSEQWKENTLRNFTSVKHPIIIDRAGKQTLTVAVNQTGIVIDQIGVTPEGHHTYYEIEK